jgi:uncharacterized protein (TIGR00251 family)
VKITVKVFPKSKMESVVEQDGAYIVRVNAPAVNNQANEAVIKALAEYFKTAKSNVEIVKGFTSRFKIVEIN